MSTLSSYLPFLFFVGLLFILLKAQKSSKSSRVDGPPLICTACGTKTTVLKNQVRGSILIEIILWLAFLIPGLIYSIWRLTTKKKVCPTCGSLNLIPIDSPAGKKIDRQYGPDNN
jgi:hypothetical protein